MDSGIKSYFIYIDSSEAFLKVLAQSFLSNSDNLLWNISFVCPAYQERHSDSEIRPLNLHILKTSPFIRKGKGILCVCGGGICGVSTLAT